MVKLVLLICIATAFTVNSFIGNTISSKPSPACRTRVALYMGRAAAVRAATKARTDGAKAKNNGRFAKKIIMAVKAGGPDPVVNRQLATVIADAKASNVPKDIVDRNIAKASAAATADYKESLFEFYGHGGVGLLVNVLTDNDNRAASDINLVAKKQNLKSASMGSVSFNFDKKARLDVGAVLNEDSLLEMCLECGVDDFQLHTNADGFLSSPKEDGKSVVFVSLPDMPSMRDALRAAGFQVETSLAAIPKTGYTAVSEEDFELNMNAIDAFEALDDVDSVEHNIDTSIGDD
eukprot:gene1786-3469_t